MPVQWYSGLPVRTPALNPLCCSPGNKQSPHSTVRVYRNGEFTEYTGPRKADGIISYMIKCVTLLPTCPENDHS